MDQYRQQYLHDKMVDCCLGDVAGELGWAPFLETVANLVEYAVEYNITTHY